MMSGVATTAAVTEALRTVVDPELGINLVDLGLVYQIVTAPDRVHILLTMTTPACPLSEYIKELVREAVHAQVPGARDIAVSIVLDPPWSPDMMSDQARRELNVDL